MGRAMTAPTNTCGGVLVKRPILNKFRRLLARVNGDDQRLLLFMANKMALRKPSKPASRT
jgi:hypothetical protein